MKIVQYEGSPQSVCNRCIAYSWGKYLLKMGEEEYIFFTHDSTPWDVEGCYQVVSPTNGAIRVCRKTAMKLKKALEEESTCRCDVPYLAKYMRILGYSYP